MKLGESKKAEDYFLKAKQATEVFREDTTPLWENYPEWQTLRLSIFQNLSSVYKTLKKDKLAYELLRSSSKIIKSSMFLENSDLILSGLDLFFLDLARFSYKQKDFQETIVNADIAISFIRGILRNSNVLNDLKLKFKMMRSSLEEFLMKKNVILGFLLFLKGKSQFHLQMHEESQINLIQALNIGKAYQGENDSLTKRYANALVGLNSRVFKYLTSESDVDSIDGPMEGGELEALTPLLDENMEQLNNLLKPQQKQRRSSVFKNQSAASFFDRKVTKHCGCLDVHEAQMAKIDYDSQKILNNFRSHGPDCTDPNHHHGESGHSHSHHSSGGDHAHGHNHGGHSHNEHGGHSHGHGHGHDEEEFFQSFCSTIINKSLNRKTKNRHLNNHDLKKLYLESEMNLKRMKLIVENYAKPTVKEEKKPHKVNILYSPNHFKILESAAFQKKEASINLSFNQEKKPSIFTLLTPKTPYSKRIPFARPQSARSEILGSIIEGPLININIPSQEFKILKNNPKAQLFMSNRPMSSRIKRKSDLVGETSPTKNGFLTKRKISIKKQMNTENCIGGRQYGPALRQDLKLHTTKSSEETKMIVTDSSMFQRKNRLAKTFKMDASSPVNRIDFLKTNNNSMKNRHASEMTPIKFLEASTKFSKGIEPTQHPVEELEIEEIRDENPLKDDNNGNISERSDSSSGKSSIIIAKDLDSCLREFDRMNTPKKLASVEKKDEKKVFDFKEATVKVECEQENTIPTNEAIKEEQVESVLDKSLLKRKLASKLIREVFKNILLLKLKKRKIGSSNFFPTSKKTKRNSESPIHLRELALFTDSNSTIQKLSNISIDQKAWTFICHEKIYFMAKDLLFNRQILWKIEEIELLVNDSIEDKIKTNFSLKLILANSIEKGIIVLKFNINAVVSEEARDFRLLNEVWRQYLCHKKVPWLNSIIEPVSSTIIDENLCNMVVFLEKLAGYLQNSLFIRDKIIGKSWQFLQDNTDRLLKTKQNYGLYRQYLHDTLIYREENFEMSDYLSKKEFKTRKESKFSESNQAYLKSSIKDDNNNLENIGQIQICLKNAYSNPTSYILGDAPTPYSLMSLQYNRRDQPIVFSKAQSYSRGSQDFSSKVANFDGHKNMFQTNSFKNSLPRHQSHFRKISYEENRDSDQLEDSKFFDSVEESLPKPKARDSLKPFIRQFYPNFAEKLIICLVVHRFKHGFEIDHVSFHNSSEETSNLFIYRNSEQFFSEVVRNAKIEIQKLSPGDWKIKERKTIGIQEFMKMFAKENEIMKKIEFFMYHLGFRKTDLMKLIEQMKKIQAKSFKKIRPNNHSINKLKIFEKQKPNLNTLKPIYLRMNGKFVKITPKNNGFEWFMYDPLSSKPNNYLFIEKAYADKLIFPHFNNKKGLEFVWRSLVKQKSTFLGKKPTLIRDRPISNEKKTRVFTQFKISNMGKCYIMIDLTMNGSDFQLAFSLKPFFSKFRQYNFVLTSNEIHNNFKNIEKTISFPSDCCIQTLMRSILNDCQNFYFRTFFADRGFLYKEIRLLVNRDQFIKNQRVCSQGIVTIGQFLLKIDKQIHILTIQRNKLLDKIHILMYSCKTARSFQCSINREDFNKVSQLMGSSVYKKTM